MREVIEAFFENPASAVPLETGSFLSAGRLDRRTDTPWS